MRLILSFLSLVFFIFSCSFHSNNGGDNKSQTPVTSNTKIKSQWTILIHLSVDNNIDYSFEKQNAILSNYLTTLENIKKADINNNIQIAVLLDCYNNDPDKNGYHSAFKDGYYYLTGKNIGDDMAEEFKEINSGSVTDVESFMDWALVNCPANHYVYSIFNHGGGFNDKNINGTFSVNSSINRSIGYDESNNDSLSLNELGQVTAYFKSKIGKNIDLFYTYACLMGGTELAYEIRKNADFLLCSEEVFPADYWSYEALSNIVEIPEMTGKELGKSFCDSAYNFFSSNSTATGQPRNFTLSLIDLSKIDGLYASIDNYANEAIRFIGSDITKANYFNEAVKNSYKMYSYPTYQYVDLGDYLDKIGNNANINSSFKEKISNVKSDINDCITYKTVYGYPGASGISIFHNIWKGSNYSPDLYESILAFGTNKWAKYMKLMDSFYTSPFLPDIYESDDDSRYAKNITVDAAAQKRTFHCYNDIDVIKLDLTGIDINTNLIIETRKWTVDTKSYICLLDSSYNYVKSDDNSVNGYDTINFTVENKGVYYIMAYTIDNPGDYIIDVKKVP